MSSFRPTQDGLPVPRRYAAIIAVSLGSALTTLDSSIVTVALPTLARDLTVSASSAVLVVTIYQLMLMMTLLPFAALGDRLGLRRAYQGGQLLFVAATVLCFFARSLPFLLLVRGFQALGAAAVLSVASAMVRSIYPSSHLGRGLALNTLVATIAASAAPTLGGAILTVAGWPWLFAVCVPFGVASILIGRTALPDPNPHEDPFDLLGSLFCAAMFGFVIVGLETGVHGDSPVISAVLVAAGIGIGVTFVRRELGQARPVLPIDLLRERKIALSAVGSFAAFMASMLIILSLPFRFQSLGLSAAETGVLLAPWPFAMMAGAPISGMLSDRVPVGILGAIGMVVSVAAMIALALLPSAPSQLDIAWRVGLCGFGFSLFFSPNARQIVGSASPTRIAAAGGLVSTIRLAGQTLGATGAAALLEIGAGSGPVPYLTGAGLAVAAGLSSLIVLRPKLGRPRPEDIPDF